jgi:hypothetical protein
VVLIATDEFLPLASAEREALGMPDLAVVTVPHPIGGRDPDSARTKGRAAVAEVLAAAGIGSGGPA